MSIGTNQHFERSGLSRPGSPRRRALAGVATALAAFGLLALGVAAGDARPAQKDVTITLLVGRKSLAYDLLFANFNRVHLVPPCNTTAAEARLALEILDEALTVADHHCLTPAA